MKINNFLILLITITAVFSFAFVAYSWAPINQPSLAPPQQDINLLNEGAVSQVKIDGLNLTNSGKAFEVAHGKTTIGDVPSLDFSDSLDVLNKPIKAYSELIIEKRTDDPNPSDDSDGRLWLRTDL